MIAPVDSRLPSIVLGLLGERDGKPHKSFSVGFHRRHAYFAEDAETRATQEAQARQHAETELAKALRLLKAERKNIRTNLMADGFFAGGFHK